MKTFMSQSGFDVDRGNAAPSCFELIDKSIVRLPEGLFIETAFGAGSSAVVEFRRQGAQSIPEMSECR